MNIDLPLLFNGLFFSGIGFVYFSYGRKQANIPLALCGVTLIAYTYFVDSIGLALSIGVGLSLLPFIFRWW